VSRENRLAHATDVIENTGSLAISGPKWPDWHAQFMRLSETTLPWPGPAPWRRTPRTELREHAPKPANCAADCGGG